MALLNDIKHNYTKSLEFESLGSESLESEKCNHFSTELWTDKRIYKDPWINHFSTACETGELLIAKRILRKNDFNSLSIKTLEHLFFQACGNGYLSIAKWLFAIYCPKKTHYDTKGLCSDASNDVTRVLMKVRPDIEIDMIKDNQKSDYPFNLKRGKYYIHRVASSSGNLDVLKWLFTLDSSDDAISEVFYTASINGHIHILEYLLTKYYDIVQPQLEHATMCIIRVDNIDGMKALYKYHDKKVYEIIYMFTLACDYDSFSIARWIYQRLKSATTSQQLTQLILPLFLKKSQYSSTITSFKIALWVYKKHHEIHTNRHVQQALYKMFEKSYFYEYYSVAVSIYRELLYLSENKCNHEKLVKPILHDACSKGIFRSFVNKMRLFSIHCEQLLINDHIAFNNACDNSKPCTDDRIQLIEFLIKLQPQLYSCVFSPSRTQIIAYNIAGVTNNLLMVDTTGSGQPKTTGSGQPKTTGSEQSDDVDSSCGICFEVADDHDIITNCQHSFHYGCLNQWYKRKHDCPLCRKDIWSCVKK